MEEMTNNGSQVNTEVPAEKNSKKGIIIAVAAIVLIVAGAVIFWFNRPVYKVEKAIKNGNYEVAVKYFNKLKDADKENAMDQFNDYCAELVEDYEDESIEYSDAMDELEIFEDVLDDYAEYNDAVDSVKNLKKSRDAWSDANKYFDESNYADALAKYAEVIEKDSNYAKAQDKIVECKNKMVVGKWFATADLSQALAAQIGMDKEKVDFDLCISYTFEEDGTAILATETETMREQLNALMDAVIEQTIEQYCESYGVTRKEMDDLFVSYYGISFDEYVRSNLDMEALLSNLEQRKDYTYEINDNAIVLYDENGDKCDDKLEYRTDGTIALYAGDEDDSYKALGVELPLVFNKQ